MDRRIKREFRVWHERRTENQRYVLRLIMVLLPFGLLTLIAMTILLASFTQPLRVVAPFVFSAPAYQPLNGPDYCPGDVMEWPVAFSVRRAPVLVISVRSIWDVDENQTATLPDGSFFAMPLQFTNYTVTTDVSRTMRITLPELTPGHYELRSAAQEFNSQAAAYSVPFSVREGCRNGG